jgi:prevent-host-death family protein
MADTDQVKVITVSDLGQHTGEHMDHVLKGGSLLVTRHGRALGFFIPAKLTDEGVAVPDIAV